MSSINWKVGLASLALALATSAALAQDKARDLPQTQKQSGQEEQIYGSQLMTVQERREYRDKMRAAKTQQERDQIRAEHHALMQQRAKERGVTLADEPPARGPGRGPGGGPVGGGAGASKR